MKICQKAVDIFLAKPASDKDDRLYKNPHTAIFTGQTCCEKIHLVLELIEKEYNKNFDILPNAPRKLCLSMVRSGSKQMIMLGL